MDRKADRTDFDLGPGLEIPDPGFKLQLPLPKEGSVYDYVFDRPKLQWRGWMETVEAAPVPEGCPFNEIIVQTIDTVIEGAFAFCLDCPVCLKAPSERRVFRVLPVRQ